MQDLKKESGLEVILKDDFKLELDIRLLGGEFSSRTLKDMIPVLKDKLEPSDEPLYFMYRDVREREDEQKIKEHHLRFDLTVVLARPLGTEFNKTFGHYHPLKDGTGVTYPEVYEVISGRALYLLQKPDERGGIEEAYLIEVKAGEKVIMPPDFGHITINSGPGPLVMSNWVSDDFSSEYEEYKEKQGGAYYLLKSENKKIEKNKHYKKIPKLVKARPKNLFRLGIDFNQPMYESGCRNMDKLKYLNNPEDFVKELEPSSVFEF